MKVGDLIQLNEQSKSMGYGPDQMMVMLELVNDYRIKIWRCFDGKTRIIYTNSVEVISESR